MEFYFILVEPAVAGNIGASARAVKTMGFSSLVLVNPCEGWTEEAGWLAHGSKDILDNIKIYGSLSEAIDGMDLTIATSTRKRWLKRDLIRSDNLASFISNRKEMADKVAIVFGREESGLSNAEMQLCDIAVNIPMAVSYPSLNLSQAVMIIAYELSDSLIAVKVEDNATATVIKNDESLKILKKNISLILEKTGISSNKVLSGRIMERVSLAGTKDIKLMHSVASSILKILKQ